MSTATITTARETVEALYEAFGRGDIPAILDAISDDFTWQDPNNPAIVPFGGKYEGKQAMGRFFQNLGGSVDTTLFEVTGYITEGNKVAAIGRHGFTVKSTGKKAILDWVMIWNIQHDTPVSGRSYYNAAVSEQAFS